jgi:S-adenosylmethionine:tRNA ribosyltransferase-isomerase
VLVSDFDYVLPDELIAREPLADRAASRMLHLDRAAAAFTDACFRDFPGCLRPGDLLVVNNTRVIAARLFGHRAGLKAQPVSPRNPAARDFLQGKVEVLLTRPLAPAGAAATEIAAPESLEWEALVRPGRKIDVGEHIFFGPNGELEAEVIARGDFGERRLRFAPVADFLGLVERLGHVPLPPYMGRADRPEDRTRYQTVYASQSGSVAAPTAGLHFTPEILAAIAQRGIEIAEVTLHVGLGTFQPVHVSVVEEHHIHLERYHLSADAAARVNRARSSGRRIVAVGTTTVRTLEHAARLAGDAPIPAGGAEADLFIYPGFQFRVIGALLTNFHLPQSTLLMLVSAFAGRELVLGAYAHAVRERYRFYSYGDCMFIE